MSNLDSIKEIEKLKPHKRLTFNGELITPLDSRDIKVNEIIDLLNSHERELRELKKR